MQSLKDPEIATEYLERRWFAAQSAVKAMQIECSSRLHDLRFAEMAWRSAQLRMAELEELRDDLEQRLGLLDAAPVDTELSKKAPVRSLRIVRRQSPDL